jgi:formylglycine-generating enzyme required for sulfatase activity
MSQHPLPDAVRIPAGEFVMGAEDGDEDERPAHRVFVDEFHLVVQPVTNREYARFLRATSHRPPGIHELPLLVTTGGRDRERAFRSLAAPFAWRDGEPPADRLDHPVTLVCIDDALAYCAWLASSTEVAIRLPTEAEWEKAARGGLAGKRYPWGDELDPGHANYLPDPSLKAMHSTKPVRSYAPNSYGLYDMAGNAWQWVADWYRPDYYRTSPSGNPRGPASGRLRLVRGGSWISADPRLLACGHRQKVPPDTYSYSIGFRVAF